MKKLIYLLVLVFIGCAGDIEQFQGSSGTQSGSYANILQVGDFLYLISTNDITTLDITDRSTPVEVNRQGIDADVESIFHSNGLLFIGSRQAMLIYDIINGIPSFQSISPYTDQNSRCVRDPIVVNDTMAYVTISTELRENCGFQAVNELRLYNITDITQPILVNTVAMTNPKGLGLDGDWLFVCEKFNGLKVLDVSDSEDIKQLHHFPSFSAFDVITQNGLLLVVGPENLKQFDYSVMDEMQIISTLDL